MVAVCGGFDPLHIGHVRHFKEAKALGDLLTVILNSDDWFKRKKVYVFMPFNERKELIESIRYVDKISPYIEAEDGSVTKTLQKLKPDIFATGGHRTLANIPKSEVETCKKLGIKLVSGIGGRKIQSNSWLIKKVHDNT